jgi:glycosyltransferase involved in cell wall biosynthesis
MSWREPSVEEGKQRVDLSIVIPVYGCAETLRELHARLTKVLAPLVDNYEVVFVDDRALDGAWPILRNIAAHDACVVAIRMSRNVGQQLAITAGLAECCGERAVVMDCDLQDPPEVIPLLYERAREGFDIVFAKRKGGHQPPARLLFNRAYFALLGFVAHQSFDGQVGALSIISRRVIEAFLQFPERQRHYVMILQTIGFDCSAIAYERDTRTAGASGYTLRKLISHALGGVFFSTTRLLNWVVYVGLALAGSSMILAVILGLRWLFAGALPGWTSLIVVELFVGGVIALSVGITGLYVGKIYEEAQHRPLFFVQDRLSSRTRADDRVVPLERFGGQ